MRPRTSRRIARTSRPRWRRRGRGRLVEHEQGRVAQEGAREREALALTRRQARAAVAELGLEAVGAGGDRVRQARVGQRAPDRFRRRVGAAEADVVGDRAREQVRVLRDPGQLGVPGGQVELAQVHAADRTAPGGLAARAAHAAASTCRSRWAR